jgi:hypothetical protein
MRKNKVSVLPNLLKYSVICKCILYVLYTSVYKSMFNTDYDRSKTTGNIEYFNYFSIIITNDARCTRQIKSRSAMKKHAIRKRVSSPSDWI